MKYRYWLVLLLKLYISIALIALLILPYAVTLYFTGVEDNAIWDDLVVWEDELLILIYAPFFILWPWYLFQKKKWQLICLLGLSFCYMGNNAGNVILLTQDFAPSAGIFVAASLFPPALLLYLLTSKKKTVAQQEVQ